MFIVAIIGSYYAYAQYADKKYYDSYRLQYYYAGKSADTMGNVYNLSTSNMTKTQFEQNYPDYIKEVEKAKTYESTRKDYINNMTKYSSSNLEKLYAQLLGQESDTKLTAYNIFGNLLTAANNNDTKTVNDSWTQLNKLPDVTTFSSQREDIRAKNPDFTSLLNKQIDLANNATR